MKNIYIFLLASLSILAGCNDEFLDTFPKTQINDENFWNNPADLETYNNQLYAVYFSSRGFGTGGFDGGLLTADNLSDNTFVQIPGDVRLGINTTNNPGRSNWNWSLVRDINQMLENAARADIEEVQKNQYIAEARLLRALDYYDKLKLYGQLPIIDRVLTESDDLLFGSQLGRDEVMAFIMDDLNFAVQWMTSSAIPNRFDKNIAHGYRARISLHEGSFRKYHGLGGETTYLEAAVESSQEVINSGDYMVDVNGDYHALFSNIDLMGNKEVVFFRDYDEALQIYHNVSNILTHVDGAEFGGSKDLINDYLSIDGLPITESPLYQGDASIEDEFENRDGRLKGTFALPNTYFAGDKLYLNSSPTGIVNTASPSGYQVAKFYNESQDIQAWNRAFIDAPIMRYAEILLIFAEAKAELGSITQSDIDMTINQLRAKAGVADLSLAATVIEDIRRERRVELAFEGFRYDDLMRWKKGSKLSQPVLGLKFNAGDIADAEDFVLGTDIKLNEEGYIQSNNNYAFDENKNYYFPVPINEISLNPNLNQTPGWE